LDYADDSSNDYKSEQEHYGPDYLEIMTWPEPGFDDHAIHGSLADMNRLAATRAGDSVLMQDEFAANTPYALILEVREDDFDPAEADPMLPKEAR